MVVEDICAGLQSKDYLSEILAVYYWVLAHTRYMNDPRNVELVRSPSEVVNSWRAGRTPSLDCLPGDTLLLEDGFKFRRLADLRPGSRIWGYDRWSLVENVWYKGLLPVDAIFLNNGSHFMATPDHKVYVEVCPKHAEKCPCPLQERSRARIHVSELQPGMVMTTPHRLPFGKEEQDPRRAYVEGLYLSDGWSQDYSFQISGQDGCPKEAQKKEVEEICADLGVATTMYRKSIHVRDSEWALRMHLMGLHAPEKHALSIDLGEGAAGALLRGIMADSGANANGGRTFTSTSRLLTLQTRMLHKMFAADCSERYIVNHGGLGQNPIWRLGVRGPTTRGHKKLRVKAIERNVATMPVYDLSTDDHYVYLPEADVTVSNCDDIVALIVGMLLLLGREVRILTVAWSHQFYKGQRQYNHVFIQVREPRSGHWIVLDPVAAEDTATMLRRIKAVKYWPVA